MAVVKHAKTNNIPNWSQADMDKAQARYLSAYGENLFPPGSTIADITLAQDWNTNHTITGLPLANQRGVKVAIFGDSITNQNNTWSANTITNETSGYFTWCNYLLGQPFYFPFFANNASTFSSANFGVSGDNTTQALARINDVIAYAPDICIVLIGTNDLTNLSFTPTITQTNLTAIYETLTAAGILVVAIPILPRSSWGSLTAPQIVIARNYQNQNNFWIKNYPIRTGNKQVLVSDPTPWLIDPTSATGDPVAAYFRDGLHPRPAGAYWMGRTLADTLAYYESFGYPRFMSAADVYDANNLYGNLILNGLMAGTTGNNGTNSSGTVATSWVVQQAVGTGMTAVCSKGTTQVNGTPGTSQIIAMTANGAGSGEERIDCRQIATVTAGLQTGDIAQGGCDLACYNMTGTWLSMQPQAEITAGGVTYGLYDMDRYAMPDYAANYNTVGRCVTPPFVVPAGFTGLNWRLANRYYNTTPGTGTAEISNVWLKKVG